MHANLPPGPCIPSMLNINLDQFQGETSWEIQDTLETYFLQEALLKLLIINHNLTLCLPQGPLRLIMPTLTETVLMVVNGRSKWFLLSWRNAKTL